MCFSFFRCAFHVFFTFQVLFIDAPYTHTCTICTYMHHQMCADYHMHIHAPHACTIKGTYICAHACTTKYTCHHQIPPKHKIYIVGLPSVFYETPGQNETPVLNQLFLLLFSVLFTFQVFTKTASFHENHHFS